MAKETDKRVFVALINGAHQILVIKRAQKTNNGGQLGLPGGHLEEGETLEQGAQRELCEEVGVNIDFTQRSFIKVHADAKRTILIAKMPSSSEYRFDLNADEVECIFWLKVYEIAAIGSPSDSTEDGDPHTLHKSLELALPVLMDLDPRHIVSAFVKRG